MSQLMAAVDSEDSVCGRAHAKRVLRWSSVSTCAMPMRRHGCVPPVHRPQTSASDVCVAAWTECHLVAHTSQGRPSLWARHINLCLAHRGPGSTQCAHQCIYKHATVCTCPPLCQSTHPRAKSTTRHELMEH